MPYSDANALASALASPDGSGLVDYVRSETGAVPRSVEERLRDRLSVKDFGAVGDGAADDTSALLNAAAAARVPLTDSLRVFAGEIHLPPGRYRFHDVLQLAPAEGVAGLTISGSGAGCTEIVFANSAATIKCAGSRGVTFRDITFRSLDPYVDGPVAPYGIDMDQTAFTIEQIGSPLRSWRFERCDFAGFYRCFKVTQSAMCSEFFFDKCQFSQCYYLMDNDNEQAVNWNFVNCNWENEALETVKDKNEAAAFKLQVGTSVEWTGGSFIFSGRLVLYNVTAPRKIARTSHFMTFRGVRMELVDNEGNHAPFVDRGPGYATPGNSPVVLFDDCAILNRGEIDAETVVYARLWSNCSLTFRDCQTEGGRIIGLYGPFTATETADLQLIRARGIRYEDDTAGRVFDHISHNITIVPDCSGASTDPLQTPALSEVRSSGLTLVNSVHSKYLWVSGYTGSLPEGGTSIKLPPLPAHTRLRKLFIDAYSDLAYPLTVELQGPSGGSFSLTAAAGSRGAEGDAKAEIGFSSFPAGVQLQLTFTGTPQIVKGCVGLEYM
jgi:hypothetical protein